MPEYLRTDRRAPLAYLLACVVIGYSCARLITGIHSGLLLSIGFVLSLAAIVSTRKPAASKVWLLCFAGAGILSFWAYAQIRTPDTPNPQERHLPAREIRLRFKVEQTHSPNPEFASISGVARILNPPPLSRLPKNSQIFFQCHWPPSPLTQLLRGQHIEALGVLTPIPDPPSDGSFDQYLTDRDIYYRFTRISQIQLIQSAAPFEQRLHRYQKRLEQILTLGSPDEPTIAKVYTAILLGQQESLSDAQLEHYRHTGTMHFFAISGLHIGVIASVIAQALLWIRVPRHLGPFIGLPLLLSYVIVTGSEPSAIRAFLMAAFFWGAYAFKRQRGPIPALIASAVLVLLIAPEQLWHLGFQLSYIVVLHILLLGLPLHRWLRDRTQPYRYLPPANLSFRQRLIIRSLDKGLLLFSISFAAWWASVPICATFFGYITPLSVLTNLFLVHLIGLVICTGVLSLSLGLFSLTSLSLWINHAAWPLIELSNLVIHTSLRLPLHVLNTEWMTEPIGYTLICLQILSLYYAHYRDRRPQAIAEDVWDSSNERFSP